jgi:mRNA interferase RelE/StbE
MYTVIIPRSVQKAIARLQPADGRRILAAISALAHTPRPPGCLKLRDRPGWRIRVGDYRVIYDIDDDQRAVTVRVVDNRSDVYR